MATANRNLVFRIVALVIDVTVAAGATTIAIVSALACHGIGARGARIQFLRLLLRKE